MVSDLLMSPSLSAAYAQLFLKGCYVMVKHFCNIYGSKNAEWLSLVYWDCLVYPAIRASYGVRYPL